MQQADKEVRPREVCCQWLPLLGVIGFYLGVFPQRGCNCPKGAWSVVEGERGRGQSLVLLGEWSPHLRNLSFLNSPIDSLMGKEDFVKPGLK